MGDNGSGITDSGREAFRARDGAAEDAVTREQLAELDRLRGLGVRAARAFEEMLDHVGGATDISVFIRRKNGIISEYVRLMRAVRQAIILQRELMGLRPPRVVRQPAKRRPAADETPDDAEDDLREPSDTATERERPDAADDWDALDYRPVGEAIAWIRRTLGAPPPDRDPFGGDPGGSSPGSGAARGSGPPAEARPEPEPAEPFAAPPAQAQRKPAPMGRARANLFCTTHISSPAVITLPAIPPVAGTRPASALHLPARGPP